MDRNWNQGIYDGLWHMEYNSRGKSSGGIIAKYGSTMEKREVNMGKGSNTRKRARKNYDGHNPEDRVEERAPLGARVQLHICTETSTPEGSAV